jgi:tetratricopeptide (TPR) repeat protein
MAPAATAQPPLRRWRSAAIGLVVAVGAIGALWAGWHWKGAAPAPAGTSAQPTPAAFVQETACVACHAAESKAWTGSHHELAMREAGASTVLGDFSKRSFHRPNGTAEFFQRDGTYWIRTEGADGKTAEFQVKHTFGVDPLQQYLLQFTGGRLQAFTVAWDVQRKRWFDLYPNERIDSRDELHWTQSSQNWNYMCAECHSTDLHKNYDAATHTYDTRYAQITVGCQACHGPASRHLAWAEQYRQKPTASPPARGGFDVDLRARDSNVQIETCARCHSRRAVLWGNYRHGSRLLDQHLPALLDAGLYHPDGQIDGEVYEYGSFLQSKMYAKGVRCSDCHDPHTLKTRAPENALCTTCHNATGAKAGAHIDATGLQRKDYDSPAHHFHTSGKPGSQCVDCHMPTRNYMIIDARHDHSLRIPRPDLSVKIGTPNACSSCHADKKPDWAAAAIAKWYGAGRRHEPHYGETIWAGRTRQPGAGDKLASLARDAAQPDIVRATALRLLHSFPGPMAESVFRDALAHSDPMMRRTALEGIEALPPAQRVALVSPLLDDPVRGVRMEAASLLAPVQDQVARERAGLLTAALVEYEAAQRENADRPEGHHNLGVLYANERKPEQAEAEYRAAIELDPHFVPAYVNLADLQRQRANEAVAEQTLREGLRALPQDASLQHALGLSLIRQRRYSDALPPLRLAARQSRGDPRYAYVYGVALHDTGKVREAVAILESTLAQHPYDADLLSALESYARESGDGFKAQRYAQRLRELEKQNGSPSR